MAALLLLGGCGPFARRQTTTLQLDFAETLPAGWEALGTWHEINIDGDDAVEYLLFFRYDNGQVGAVVYDTQLASNVVGVVEEGSTPAPQATVGLVPIPLQSFGYYRPYRLLPSVWDFSYGGNVGHGFIAPPTAADSVSIYRVGAPDANADPAQGVLPPHGELLLRGSTTHLTFVWWRDPIVGYGVTQIVANGGFRGIDWEAYSAAPTPLTALAGLYPLADYRARSVLCREIAYTRTGAAEESGVEAAGAEEAGSEGAGEVVAGPSTNLIAYDRADRGIHFCLDPIPAFPFYPEGVVMAYLLKERAANSAPDALITPGTTLPQVDADADFSRVANEQIEDIATYPTVAVPADAIASGQFAPVTTVCVELAETADPSRRRWLLFSLRYQPPDLEARLPERWTISGAAPAPTAAGAAGATTCDTILQSQAP